MLAESFSFLPGIGEKTERRLWTRGIRSWSDYRTAGRVRGVTPSVKRQHDAVLAAAEAALARDPSFFARVLPPGEHWRAFGEFGRRAAFVDVETTGGVGGSNDLTVVGIAAAERPFRALVRGVDLTPEAVTEALRDATMLVTFNGASFDLPIIAASGAAIPDVPHLDLRFALRRLGLTGGLKRIEEQTGLGRRDGVSGLDGWDAVVLWHRHCLGDPDALPLLVEYNRADVENLLPLARLAYSGLRRDSFEAACAAPSPPARAPAAGGAARAGPPQA